MNKRYAQAGIYRTIKLLDGKIPKWRRLVDGDDLDIGSVHDCITAHVFGCYDKGLQELGLAEHDAQYYGLALNVDALEDEAKYDREYAKLTQLWKEALEADSG